MWSTATASLRGRFRGVGTEARDGIVYVSRKSLGLPVTPRRGDFGGSDLMPLRDAIRAGHIEVNG